MLHRYWAGDVRPSFVDQYGAEFVRLHPDVEVRNWTFESLPQQLQADLRSMSDLVRPHDLHRHQSNLIRYWLLRECGGIWADADLRPLRSFVPLFGGPFAVQIGAGLTNCVLGGPAGHPLFADLYESAKSRTGEAPSAVQSGGVLLSEVVARRPEGIRILPGSLFCEFDSQGNLLRQPGSSGITPYSNHLWATTRSQLYLASARERAQSRIRGSQ